MFLNRFLWWSAAGIAIAMLAIVTAQQTDVNYKGYKVFRLQLQSNESLKKFDSLYANGSYDFWKEPTLSGATDIMVSPSQIPQLQKLIASYKIPYEVMFQNLFQAIKAERRNASLKTGSGMNWDAYQRLDTIYDWLDTLVSNSSSETLRVSVETYGYSFEKRPLKVVKITNTWRVNNAERSAVWIDAGIHAREWIAPATATYLIKEIIDANRRNEIWAASIDWYIAPVLNPDGYEFSHTTDRFWRKTRSFPRPDGSSIVDTLLNLCVGADPNRNWDYQWGGLGGSSHPCAPTYRGRSNASEDEVKYTQDYILTKKDKIKLFLSLHSYSQMVLLPWGHTYLFVEDYADLKKLADRAADKLYEVQGTSYRRGATPHILYPAAGGSHDWAKGVAKIKFSYVVELPDRGFFGFLLPASWIKGTGQEMRSFVKSMADDLIKIYYSNTAVKDL